MKVLQKYNTAVVASGQIRREAGEDLGVAAMTVEVQIVPKAIYSDQKTSHRLYTVARANSYAAYRGLAEEDSSDDDDDDADVAGDEEDLGVLTPTDAQSPAEVPVWKFWARE